MHQLGNVFVFTTLFVVLIGLLPCKAEKCTVADLSECRKNMTDHRCGYKKKALACLGAIKTDCTDDALIEQIAAEMAGIQTRLNECPGLPDGTCIFTVMELCQKIVPYEVDDYIPDDEKMKKCNEFKGKSAHAKLCMEALNTHCVTPFVKQYVDDYVKGLKHIVEICAKYH